ncbi:hypothetical protein TNCV_2184041 [Trichonephila clavipes]|nr:hypothetical protein TNCV_2184041 [Trichonephila clavipes]
MVMLLWIDRVFLSGPSCSKKSMLISFFDRHGVIHKEYVPPGQAGKAVFYVYVLVLKTPPKSPDLSPVDHICREFEFKVPGLCFPELDVTGCIKEESTCVKKLLGVVDTRRYPRAENWVWRDQEDHEERGSKDRAASTCGPHSNSFNDTSRRRRSNCSTNNFQTPYRSKS